MNVTLRQLRAFVAVAHAGGFSAAAQRLHLTQSALSALVRSLEEEVGGMLFERTTRVVRLTDGGRALLPQAERLLVDLHDAVASTRALSEQARGRLVVAVTPTFASTMLPAVVASYRSRHPEVLVVLRDDAGPAQIRRLVQEGEADLGIAPLDRSIPELLMVDALLDHELVLACPPDHRFARRRAVAWRELAEVPLIGFPRDNALQALVDTAVSGLRLRASVEVSSISTAVALVEAGLGASVLPSYARAAHHRERIRYCRLVEPTVRRELCMLRHRDRVPSPAAQSFAAELIERARRKA